MADSVLDLIGDTPLVRLARVGAGVRATVVAKLETTNPGGSVKDRAALGMLEAAERDGLVGPGSTIIEKTSGNTGIGLAIVSALRGYRCIFVMTEKAAPEKVALLRAYGSEVIVCPVGLPDDDPRSATAVTKRLLAEIPDSLRPDQYENPANPAFHERTTGPEIWRQTDGTVAHFVATAGTGGTIVGTGRYLKAMNLDPTRRDAAVTSVMGPRLPRLGIGESLVRAGEVLASSPAAVVHDGGRPIALITSADLGSRSSR